MYKVTGNVYSWERLGFCQKENSEKLWWNNFHFCHIVFIVYSCLGIEDFGVWSTVDVVGCGVTLLLTVTLKKTSLISRIALGKVKWKLNPKSPPASLLHSKGGEGEESIWGVLGIELPDCQSGWGFPQLRGHLHTTGQWADGRKPTSKQWRPAWRYWCNDI